MDFNVFQRTNPKKILFSAIFAIIAVVCPCIVYNLQLTETVANVFYAISVILGAAVVCIVISCFKRDVALHADENGILSVYCFYIPWEHIEKVYTRSGDYTFFLEIKIKDRDKFLASLDRDLYDAYTDELDDNLVAGHEMFFFELDGVKTKGEDIVKTIMGMKKDYTKKKR